MSSLYESIRESVLDRSTAAFVQESTQSPLIGPGKPIAPPTYGVDKGAVPHAFTADAFVPAVAANGWHTDLRRDADGNLIRADQVVINSVPAESGRAESGLWFSQTRLGITLPGITVGAPDSKVIDTALATLRTSPALKGNKRLTDKAESQARDALVDFDVSSWTLAHRHNDAWIKYCANPDGSQVWEGGAIRELITAASAQKAALLFSYFPNAAVFGMWLSSGVSQRHRVPRAYSSEIVGYEVRGINRAATKLDTAGGASNETKVNLVDGALVIAKGHKPSDLGFGPIPTAPHQTAYQCGQILQQSSITLATFRSFRFADDVDQSKAHAAATVFALLAITGHEIAAEDGFLRSECSLARESSRWGRRLSNRSGDQAIEEFDVPNADAAAEALREALDAAHKVGLDFAEPMHATMSQVQADIVCDRIAREITKTADQGD